MGLFIIAANLSNISSKRALWILLLAIHETKNNNQMTRQNKRNTHPKIVFSAVFYYFLNEREIISHKACEILVLK